MFNNWIRKTDYDAEHELRLRAEARERAQEVLIADLRRENGALLAALSKAGELQARSQTDLLDRLVPKPGKVGVEGMGETFQHMTAAEIRAMPAVGKRQMELRESQAKLAETRDLEDPKPGSASSEFAGPPTREDKRDAKLTGNEAAELDEMITGKMSATSAVN